MSQLFSKARITFLGYQCLVDEIKETINLALAKIRERMFCPLRSLLIVFLFYRSSQAIAEMYSFTTENLWLPMPDGIRLSATLSIPIPKQVDEKFPVLLEYKPYRKDDSFYNYNQASIYYLVRRGFIVSPSRRKTTP